MATRAFAAQPIHTADTTAPRSADSIDLIVPKMHCAGCLSKVEAALQAIPGVTHARANLSTKRVRASGSGISQSTVRNSLAAAGFEALPASQSAEANRIDKDAKELLLCLAIAGFAMMNIMLLSVSVWAGLVSGMDEETRTLFHWISALIAVPTVLFSGRPFFRSALGVLAKGRTNMDVPIALAVLLSTAASLLVTIRGGEHAYFDAAVMLLFFLLCGRYLDKTLRARTFSAAQALLKLQASEAQRLLPDGSVCTVDIRAVTQGMTLQLLPGERVPVDCVISTGQSDIDMSMVTGESAPISVGEGSMLYAGTLNITGTLAVTASGDADHSFLADMIRIMESAEQSRAPLVNLADKVARRYAPVVHTLAALTFAGWLALGMGWYPALMIAVAVLIITCPCALGLAVPAVQVTAVGKLLKDGIVLRTGDALDRLCRVDTIVFDKTGTLTTGEMTLENKASQDPQALSAAAHLATHSNHPLAKALGQFCEAHVQPQYADVQEHPGDGISARDVRSGNQVRLGRRPWAAPDMPMGEHRNSELVFLDAQGEAHEFWFSDTLRPGAAALMHALSARGYHLEILSGDKPEPVKAAAAALGIAHWHSRLTPQQKVEHLNALKAAHRNVLMVGDGLNDAPALRAALLSMSPSSATDVAQVAADIVYQGVSLDAVRTALDMARKADKKVKQNFALALAYNFVAVPLAIFGLVTPLIAALAMSASSLLVTGNAALLRTRAQQAK
ncbi:MAG: heavy metal translocating P-type ATPase [Pseudomonadota bacterium]